MEGLPPREDEITVRHFSNAVMNWKITNISLALCTPSMEVHSPGFSLSGPTETKWRMSLDISSEHDRIVVYLQMLPCKIPELNVKVDWVAYVLNCNGEGDVSAVVQQSYQFYPGRRLTVDSFELWSAVGNLPDASPDVLKIRCCMLVHFDNTPRIPLPEHLGIRALCLDLAVLPNKHLYSDMTVEINNGTFPLHRAMLYHRSDKLNSMIQPHLRSQNIRLYLSDKHALNCLFSYLYTGDLTHVFANPSVMIGHYIKWFGIPELKNIYPVEKLKMESKIEADEHVFTWTICDFRNIKEPVSGIELHEEGMDSRWQLHVHPDGPPHGGPLRHKRFLYVEAELLESAKESLNVCLEFASINDEGRVMHIRRTHGRMEVGERLGLEYFKLRGTNMERCMVDDALILRFTVRIATGETIPWLIDQHLVPPQPIASEQAFNILSRMMGHLLDSHDFSDVSLSVEGELFKAHRFLLALRSAEFKSFLDATRRDSSGVVITIQNMNKHVFRLFLQYLYTGIIKDHNPEVVMELYDVGIVYRVPSLIDLCTNMLVTCTDETNVLKFLCWSHDRRESRLKSHALKVIAPMVHTIRTQPGFVTVAQTKPALFRQLSYFLQFKCGLGGQPKGLPPFFPS